MIEAQNLHKRFGDIVAVNGLSFTARDGEVTGLLGPNGSGKTTSLRMLLRFDGTQRRSVVGRRRRGWR